MFLPVTEGRSHWRGRGNLPSVTVIERGGGHDALQELTKELRWGGHHFVVEAEIQGFFDHLQHDWLLRMLAQRIEDGALLNQIRKWLWERVNVKSPVRENCSPGSVRGAPSNRCPYLDHRFCTMKSNSELYQGTLGKSPSNPQLIDHKIVAPISILKTSFG
jgi:hypothetical protein